MMLDHRRRLGGQTGRAPPKKFGKRPCIFHLLPHFLQIWIFPTNMFDKCTPVCSTYWSTAEATLSRGWSILSVFPARRNIIFTTTGLQVSRWTVFWFSSFTLTSHPAEKAMLLQNARCLVIITWQCELQRVYTAWRFSCSEISSNSLLYWKEKPMRILHFCCPYLHTSIVRMSSGTWCFSDASVNDLDAFQENERICS